MRVTVTAAPGRSDGRATRLSGSEKTSLTAQASHLKNNARIVHENKRNSSGMKAAAMATMTSVISQSSNQGKVTSSKLENTNKLLTRFIVKKPMDQEASNKREASRKKDAIFKSPLKMPPSKKSVLSKYM